MRGMRKTKLKIKELRRQRGITQLSLSQMSGVSRTIISFLETGSAAISTTQVSTLEKIATALGVKVADLLDEDNP